MPFHNLKSSTFRSLQVGISGSQTEQNLYKFIIIQVEIAFQWPGIGAVAAALVFFTTSSDIELTLARLPPSHGSNTTINHMPKLMSEARRMVHTVGMKEKLKRFAFRRHH
jgi:hypothetical protein